MENNVNDLNDLLLNSIVEKLDLLEKKLDDSLNEYEYRKKHDKTVVGFLISLNEKLDKIYEKVKRQNSLLVKLIPFYKTDSAGPDRKSFRDILT